MDRLTWNDLTPAEKDQAILSYVSIRSTEEQVPEDQIDPSGVERCSWFERQENGYIYVNI